MAAHAATGRSASCCQPRCQFAPASGGSQSPIRLRADSWRGRPCDRCPGHMRRQRKARSGRSPGRIEAGRRLRSTSTRAASRATGLVCDQVVFDALAAPLRPPSTRPPRRRRCRETAVGSGGAVAHTLQRDLLAAVPRQDGICAALRRRSDGCWTWVKRLGGGSAHRQRVCLPAQLPGHWPVGEAHRFARHAHVAR